MFVRWYARPTALEQAEYAEESIRCSVSDAIHKLVTHEDSEKKITELLTFYREEGRFEMSVLGTRVTWLLAAQTFLVSGSAVALSNAVTSLGSQQKGNAPLWLLTVMTAAISVIGFLLARRSTDAIERAKVTVDLWLRRVSCIVEAHNKYEELCRATSDHPRTMSSATVPSWMARMLGRWIEVKQPPEGAGFLQRCWRRSYRSRRFVACVLCPLFGSVPQDPTTPRLPGSINDTFHQESMQFSNLMPILFAWYWTFLFFGSLMLTAYLLGLRWPARLHWL
jgi:hypothetical protein